MARPEREREAVKSAYKNEKWWRMVDLKTDAEVFAIYKSLKQQKKI